MRAIRLLAICGAIGSSLVGVQAARADVVLSPVSGTASDTYSLGGTPLSNTYQQVGLDPTFTSGVTNWNTYFAGDPVKNWLYTNAWFTNYGVSSAVVIYDLGATYNISDFALWLPDLDGIGNTNVLYSTNGTTYSPLLTGIVPVPTNAVYTDYGAQFFSFSTVSARYVELQINACPLDASEGYTICAIGEVAFQGVSSGVPEPSTWVMALMGVAGLAFSGYRRKTPGVSASCCVEAVERRSVVTGFDGRDITSNAGALLG